MVVQVIGLLKDAFTKAGLGLYLAPYGVLPTAYECGIIEVVPNSKSRSALGETTGPAAHRPCTYFRHLSPRSS